MLDPRGAKLSFQRLKTGEPVYFASDACLIVHRAGYECGVCGDACPSGVLTAGDWSVRLDTDGCVGCGFCAVACPTGALMVKDCAPIAVEAAGERIVLECRRVAPADRDPNAVTVPCLGGLATADLLDFLERTEASVALADHGWCADCAVGRCSAPWQSTLDETSALLDAIDARLADQIGVERNEIPIAQAQPVMPALRPDKQVYRREFLRRVIGAVEPLDASSESPQFVFDHGPVSPLKRQRILGQIGALAANISKAMPPSLMPAITIADGCDLDGVCAAICPTAALWLEKSDDSIELWFNRADCIVCGLCERVCTSKALTLWTQGDGSIPDKIETLAARSTMTCVRCGSPFTAADDRSLCLACSKDVDVAQLAHNLTRGRVRMAEKIADPTQ